MNYTYVALKKILNELVPEKYPAISDVKIIDDSFTFEDFNYYKVYLGVKSSDFKYFDKNNPSNWEFINEISEYVKQVSKYVLGNNETIQKVIFYNLED